MPKKRKHKRSHAHMSLKKYEVPIIYRGLSNFIVKARNAEEAKAIALAKFNNGDLADLLGNESESVDHVGEITELKTR